jgi:hypothetical protein
MPVTSTMNAVHAGNATRMAIRFAEHLSEQGSLTVPAELGRLADAGPVGKQLAELGWVTLSKAMGEARVPRAHTRAMIRAMADHALARETLERRTSEAFDSVEADSDPIDPDPFAGLPVG